MRLHLVLPEIVSNLSLKNTVGCKLCILPAGGAVTSQFSPVAVPCLLRVSYVRAACWETGSYRSSIERLGSVVVSLSMSAHEQNLVYSVARCLKVQCLHLYRELLPLGEVAVVGDVLGGWIGSVD